MQVAFCTVHCIIAIASNKFLVSFQQCAVPENTPPPPPPPTERIHFVKNSKVAKGLKGNKIKEVYGDKFESSEGWELLHNYVF